MDLFFMAWGCLIMARGLRQIGEALKSAAPPPLPAREGNVVSMREWKRNR
jgi:hypothetical protein